MKISLLSKVIAETQQERRFSVYLDKFWYLFSPSNRQTINDPVKDVSYLSKKVFDPILEFLIRGKMKGSILLAVYAG